MGSIVLGGAIDMHCHFGPESVVGTPHSVDAFEAARDAARLDFAAVVLKSHDFPTNQVAYAVEQTVPGVRVLGSVCCDFCIGGLNPGAVETALRDGASIVWLPTISSQQDVENGVAEMLKVPGGGIELFDERGRLRDEVEEILALVMKYDAIAATGHTSKAEHFAVAKRFARRGRLVVTHAMNSGAGPKLTPGECVELAELGAYIELAAATCMASHGPLPEIVVKTIDAIGPGQVVLSTDYGWSDELPHPAPGLLAYVDALWAAGAKESQLRQMACDNPARLLRLSAG
jgi:hypothetical protein